MPQPRTGFYPPGGFPREQPGPLIGDPLPSCRFRDRAQVLDNSRASTSASRGSRALLHSRVRLPCSGVTLHRGSIPSWASSLSRVLPPPAVEVPSHLLRS
jgi:hypothetical protein